MAEGTREARRPRLSQVREWRDQLRTMVGEVEEAYGDAAPGCWPTEFEMALVLARNAVHDELDMAERRERRPRV